LASVVERQLEKISPPSVFFFDRVSRAAIILAQEFREKGSLVVFEPSGIGDPKLFSQALDLSHVLKYANDRIGNSLSGFKRNGVMLEIETLGKEGIRFRSKLFDASNRWKSTTSFVVPRVKDAAGSGDWFTATLISQIGSQGANGLSRLSEDSLRGFLRFAQAAAAWNCAFEAPRGGMYLCDKEQFWSQVRAIESGEPVAIVSDLGGLDASTSPDGACLHCHSDRRRDSRRIARLVRQTHCSD
jgi:hypothetical protein